MSSSKCPNHKSHCFHLFFFLPSLYQDCSFYHFQITYLKFPKWGISVQTPSPWLKLYSVRTSIKFQDLYLYCLSVLEFSRFMNRQAQGHAKNNNYNKKTNQSKTKPSIFLLPLEILWTTVMDQKPVICCCPVHAQSRKMVSSRKASQSYIREETVHPAGKAWQPD